MTAMSQSKSGFFITGTDTGVGKTLITCALLEAFSRKGQSVAGMKPVAAGCVKTTHGLECEDMTLLRAHSNVMFPPEIMNPYAFEPPLAPEIAARQAGMAIEFAPVIAKLKKMQEKTDIVLVEGVGGYMVPLNESQTTADLAVKLALPVIMVVGMRLGCINHALLTVQAIAQSGLQLAGWVANQVDPAMQALEENIESLCRRIDAPFIGFVPYCDHYQSADMSRYLNLDEMLRLNR